jgi:RNA polymerase sigma-70 factor, ECF subfamily
MTRDRLELLTDDELMTELREDRMPSLGEIYRRHGAMVESALMRFVPGLSGQETEDLCQDVFIRLRALAGRYRQNGKLKVWLYGIALQMARSRTRDDALHDRVLKRSGRERCGVSLATDDSPEHAATVRDLIEKTLGRLPREQWEVVVLYEVEGLSGAEIAEILEIQPQAVWTRLHRARRRLLDAVRECEDSCPAEDAAGLAYARKS